MKNWRKLIIALIIGFSMARVIFLIVHNSNIVDLPFIEFIYSFLNGLRYDISVIGYFTLPVLLIYIFVLLFGKIFPLINSIFQEFIRYYGIAITVFILIAFFVDLGFCGFGFLLTNIFPFFCYFS